MFVEFIVFELLKFFYKISLAVTIFGILIEQDYLVSTFVAYPTSSPNKLTELEKVPW
jgi:hypothetical protein